MRHTLQSATFLAIVALVAFDGTAAAQKLEDSYQTWGSLTLQGHVTPKVQLYIDLNGRFYDDFSPYQILIRPAVGLLLAPGMYAWLGYGWTPSWTTEHDFIDEHRAWQQWSYDIPTLPTRVRLFLRSRLEQRFRPETSSDVGFRLRQLARLYVYFARDSVFYFALADEAFVALNHSETDEGQKWQQAGFDQNRLFGGLGWNTSKNSRVEMGYLNQWITRPGIDTVHHVLAINAFVTIR